MGQLFSTPEPKARVETEPVQPILISPWREFEFSDSELDNVRDKIENYSPRSTLSVPDAKILLIGPVGSGKSSFVNTINSIFNDTITNQTNSGKSYNSLTTVYRQHRIQSKRKEGCLRFQLCDTPGLQENYGPTDNNLKHLFDGKLPDGCKVSYVDVNPNIEGFNKRPELKDQVHCVVFVLDATTLEVLGSNIRTQLHSLLRELNTREIPKVIVLTKIDELSKMVEDDVSNVFRCPRVKAAVKRAAEVLGVTLNTVHPIKNYEHEVVLNAKISQLAIVALDQIIGFADNCLVKKSSPIIVKSWRDVPDFNDQNRTTLMSKIANFSIPANVNVPEARILMIGPVGAGKSSFFNTINSIFNDRITNQSNTGSAASSLTTVYRQYQVRCGLNGQVLKFRLCDTCGIEEKKGPCLTDLVYLLEGNVPDGYAFSHSSPINRNICGFVSHPKLKDQIHCVVFVLDASTVQVASYLTWNKINQFQTELNRREIPKVIILTKIDTLSNTVSEDVSAVYQCPKVKKAVETVSATLGVPQHNIWPIKNYETEVCLNEKVSNLTLLALDQILGFANDFLIKKEASFRIDPWRDSLFTRETRTGLMARIESFNPPTALDVYEARILMIGPVGAGKSSFFNTINSIFNDRITNQSNTGSAASSLTTVYRQYKVQSGRTGQMLNFRLCDTCGIEETNGPSLSDLLYLLDGNVPDGYQFNPSSPIDPKIPGFIKRPRLKDQVHCVVFVFDASTVELVSKSVWTKVAQLQSQINKREIPKAVLLTKIDKLAVIVEEDLSRVFECEDVKKAVEKMSDTIGLPRQNIWPIKNYESEICINEKVNVLALGALDQILGFARDFLMKKEALMSFVPWRNAPPFTRENKLALAEKIENYSPPSVTKLSQARILMIGPVQAGKSSFCNTINSIFSDQITHRSVVSSSATNSVTKEYRQFQFRSGRTGRGLKFCLCDTCGIAERFGPDSTEMVYLVDGNIPDGYEFNPSSPITPEQSGFIHQPGLDEMVHCVVFVFDGSTLEKIPRSVWDKLKCLLVRMNKKGTPHIVLLTKIDEMVKEVDYNISRVYECTEIKMAVEKVSQMLEISPNDVMPIQNYVDEGILNDQIDNLALLAIHKVLGYANEFALKRLDVKDSRQGFDLDNKVVLTIVAVGITAALVTLITDVKITLAFIFITMLAMIMYRLYLG
ncbi:hypothetical protein ACJMK2_007501 [Sinanodonta woodiana]|uniref:G domain-containing protein n=1 Tax=Sinanodonta woodiana TaxID=1069815 RepID=A0ABD3VIR0_SINWO